METCDRCKAKVADLFRWEWSTKFQGRTLTRLCHSCCANLVHKMLDEEKLTTKELVKYANRK